MVYKCPYCEFESFSRRNLELHIKEEHTAELEEDEEKK